MHLEKPLEQAREKKVLCKDWHRIGISEMWRVALSLYEARYYWRHHDMISLEVARMSEEQVKNKRLIPRYKVVPG